MTARVHWACPLCPGATRTRVIDKEHAPGNNGYLRTYECDRGHRFKTHEAFVPDSLDGESTTERLSLPSSGATDRPTSEWRTTDGRYPGQLHK